MKVESDDIVDRIVYVPQGRSVRFVKFSKQLGIAGLYTDSFSTCNALAVVGADKIILAHLDVRVNEQLDQVMAEIQWVDNPLKAYIIYRKKEGAILNQRLLDYFQRYDLKIEFEKKFIDNDMDGIFVSFTQARDSLSFVQLHPIRVRPNGLLHHPQEQKITAAHKIEQIVGLVSRAHNKIKGTKKLCIFDGLSWEKLAATEETVDVTQTRDKEVMNFLMQGKDFFTIAGYLVRVVQSLLAEGVAHSESLKDLVMPIAPELEGYLKGFDCELLFKINFANLLDKSNPQGIFSMDDRQPDQIDLEFVKKLLSKLRHNKSTYEQVETIVEQYKSCLSPTSFRQQLVGEFNTFSRHYQERKRFSDLAEERRRFRMCAKEKAELGLKFYREKNYVGASENFLEALKLYASISFVGNVDVAALCMNLGRAHHYQEDYNLACIYLEKSLDMFENSSDPRAPALKEKATKFLEESRVASEASRAAYGM